MPVEMLVLRWIAVVVIVLVIHSLLNGGVD